MAEQVTGRGSLSPRSSNLAKGDAWEVVDAVYRAEEG